MKCSLSGRRIWITGASSGIGEALAIELSGQGCRLVLSGRKREKLDTVAAACSQPADVLPFDVADRDATHNAARWIEQRHGGIDVAVLNAGTCEYVDLPVFDAALIKRVMDVNFMGTVYGVEAALPLLRKGNKPYLVGMSSTVAYTGLPRAEAYGSSKAAIRHLFQCLGPDLAGEGIDVSTVCPGFVKTPLTDRNDFPMPMRISPERAARAIVRGMERRTPEISFPRPFVIGIKILASLPHWLKRPILLRMSPASRP